MKRLMMVFLALGFILSNLCFAAGSQVTIRYDGNNTYGGAAQIEIFNGEGQRVILDLCDPGHLSAHVIKNDILLTTSDDYFTADFIRDFPGEKLLTRVGEIKRDGLYIRGIASNRDEKDEFPDEKGTNYIFVIETAGLRIADFGYIGQKRLTQEQLTLLGNVDIALVPFYNFRNGMNAYNRKGFNLMDQVHPRIIIPTGLDMDTAQYAVEKWPGSYCESPALKISREQLPQQTRVIFMGSTARQYGLSCKVPKIGSSI